MRIRPWRRVYLGAEYTALFFGGTTVYNMVMRGKPPIHVGVAAAAALLSTTRTVASRTGLLHRSASA
ncbi:hypothetical protein [Nocardia amamiensis]|uniref:hypothetical protein n=1 Tax=Nocardia TaxID=1817 RepID=UPI003410F4D3